MSTIRKTYFLIIFGILFCLSTSASLSKSSLRFSNDQIGSIEKGKLDDNNSSNPSAFDLFKDDMSNNQDERRRVTKTVFIAPGLPECPPGYREDEKQRCNKELTLNEAAYFDFLSERLSNLFPSDNKSSVSSNPAVQSVPFKLNIPLVIDTTKNTTENTDKIHENNMENSTSTSSTIIIDNSDNQSTKINDKNSSIIVNKTDDALMTNEEEEEIKDEQKFFLGPMVTEFSGENDKSTTELPVPVVDFVDDMNNFSYSDLVNYKTPEFDDNKSLNNTSIDLPGFEFIEASNNEFTDKEKTNQSTTTMDLSTTLAPTTLNLLDLLSSTSTEKEDIVKSSTEITFDRETISESLPESTTENFVKVSLNGSDGDNLFDLSSTSVKTDVMNEEKVKEEEEEIEEEEEEIKHVTENYQEENGDKGSTVVDENEELDDSTESDELLTHSETGMVVTIPPSRVKPLSTPTQVDSSTDTTGSTISSEVTINDDFVRETTLLNLNNNNNNNKNIIMPINTENKILVLQADENKVNTNQEVTLLPVDITSTSTSLKIENNDEKRDGEFKISEIPNDGIKKQILFPSTSEIINDGLSTKKIESISDIKIDESALIKIFDKFFPSVVSKKPDNFVFPTTTTRTTSTTTDKTPEENNSEIMQVSSTNSAEIILQDDNNNNKRNEESFLDEKKIINSPDSKTLDNQKIEIKYLTTTPAVININEQYDVDNNHASVINSNKPDDAIIRQQYEFSDLDNKNFGYNNKEAENLQESNWKTSESSRNHVRFPNYERPPQNQIKFPSNSIISHDDFKERNHYRVYPPASSTFIDNNNSNSNSNNNSNSKKKKPSNWPWRRTNRQQSSFQQRSSFGNDKLSKLLQFWTRIPLEKNLNSAYPTVSAAERYSGKSKDSRRFNLYEGISPQDKTRSFAISSSN